MNTEQEYVNNQVLHCMGSKRKLLPNIGEAINYVQESLGKEKLSIIEPFAGTGIVSRYMRQFASCLVVSDLEDFAYVLAECYQKINPVIARITRRAIYYVNFRMDDAPMTGFITELYSPVGGRTFYTVENAQRIDRAMNLIHGQGYNNKIKPFLLGPLIVQARLCANIAGHFDGYLKKFQASALKPIVLPYPVTSNHILDNIVCLKGDAYEVLAEYSNEADLVYLDPPYNQRNYGCNYFMLNLIATNEAPKEEITKVIGRPVNWQRSDFCSRRSVAKAFRELFASISAKYAILSYSNEGILSMLELLEIINEFGRIEKCITIEHQRFKSQTDEKRHKTVEEYLLTIRINK